MWAFKGEEETEDEVGVVVGVVLGLTSVVDFW